jgi:hypothetical protein
VAAEKKKGSSSGYLRLKRAAEDGGASAKQLRAATKAYNERYCVQLSGTKAQLRGRMGKVAKRLDTISSDGGGGGWWWHRQRQRR